MDCLIVSPFLSGFPSSFAQVFQTSVNLPRLLQIQPSMSKPTPFHRFSMSSGISPSTARLQSAGFFHSLWCPPDTRRFRMLHRSAWSVLRRPFHANYHYFIAYKVDALYPGRLARLVYPPTSSNHQRHSSEFNKIALNSRYISTAQSYP
jgi:hypothetical protein